jgi:ubiquinol-cytochrome c reductase cytochrome c1 subunit
MKNLLSIIFGLLVLLGQQAFASGVSLESADADVSDIDSLKRGAKYFVDYCSGCHAMKHLRYSRIASDFQMAEPEFKKLGLMAPGVKIHDSLEGSMHPEDSKDWLGVPPPDLSLIARARGADWLFTYLKGFYADPSRPTGSNNIVLANVGMPNVLWQLQGIQEPVFRQDAGEAPVFERMKIVQEGELSGAKFDQMLNDLVAFLKYAGEPSQFQRVKVGRFVLLALIAFSAVLYKLKKEYWRDIS